MAQVGATNNSHLNIELKLMVLEELEFLMQVLLSHFHYEFTPKDCKKKKKPWTNLQSQHSIMWFHKGLECRWGIFKLNGITWNL